MASESRCVVAAAVGRRAPPSSLPSSACRSSPCAGIVARRCGRAHDRIAWPAVYADPTVERAHRFPPATARARPPACQPESAISGYPLRTTNGPVAGSFPPVDLATIPHRSLRPTTSPPPLASPRTPAGRAIRADPRYLPDSLATSRGQASSSAPFRRLTRSERGRTMSQVGMSRWPNAKPMG